MEINSYERLVILPIHNIHRKTIKFAMTMVAPVGVPHTYEPKIPTKKHSMDITAEETITDLKLLKTLIEDSAGNIIKLEINSEPIKRIPTTIVIAVRIAIKKL